jgi:hypothetical protein
VRRPGAPGVVDADVDAPSGHDQGAATGHPPLDADELGCRDWCRPGWSRMADPGDLGRGEWVGQAAQQDAVGCQLQGRRGRFGW